MVNSIKKKKKKKNHKQRTKHSHSESASRGTLLVDIVAKEITLEYVSGSDGDDLDGDKESNEADHCIDEDGSPEVPVDVVVIEDEIEVRS
jgi:hypothetical protein